MIPIPLWHLTKSFLLVKFIQLTIVYFTPVQFDTSSQLIISQLNHNPTQSLPSFIVNILNKLIVWDSVYFNDLFVNEYKWEHTFVFCPNWIWFIRAIPVGNQDYYVKFFISILISNLCHYLSIIVLYYLTMRYFDSRHYKDQTIQHLSQLSCLFLIISSAGIFLTINYSENLCNLLTYGALYLYDKSINYHDFKMVNKKSVQNHYLYIISGIVIGITFTIRANSLLMGIIYLIDVYQFWFINRNIYQSMWAVMAGLPLLFMFMGTNLINYIKFCPDRGEWCNYNVPILFQYAQLHYWNVGFLKYWHWGNLPNFLIVLPTFLIQIFTIKWGYQQLPTQKKLLNLIIINSLVNMGAIFFWNVQILTRIITFLPLQYWYLSILYEENNQLSKIIIYYCLIWNFLQSSLLAAFLPPA